MPYTQKRSAADARKMSAPSAPGPKRKQEMTLEEIRKKARKGSDRRTERSKSKKGIARDLAQRAKPKEADEGWFSYLKRLTGRG